MAYVIPFKGILYDTNKIGSIADVVAPPYDVISTEEQQELHDRHQNNIVRLILGQSSSSDNESNNPHTRAAEYFDKWNKEGVFVKDEKPCFYLEASEFRFEEKILSRLGLIGRVKIESLDKGIIMPHEKTFSKVKSERLGLIKATKMNFSCIFGLYPDKKNVFDRLCEIINTKKPILDFINHDGLKHRLWKIEDLDFNSFITTSLENERIIIADGHHRYETALNYRNYLSSSNSDFNEKDPSNYVMMYLSSMNDPALIVKPTHRMIKKFTSSDLKKLIDISSKYFDINSFKGSRSELLKKLESFEMNSFILVTNNPLEYSIFVLKKGVMDSLYSKKIPASLRKLDVTVLTKLVFIDLMKLNQKDMDDTSSFGYISDTNMAFDKVEDRSYGAAFILNPTKVEEVKKVAEEGLIMPRKSTFFYPKVVSGLVQNSIK